MRTARRSTCVLVLLVLVLAALSTVSNADPARSRTRPAVSAISAAEGPVAGGTRVSISGRHLAGVTSVRFGGARADFHVTSARRLVATSPAHPAGPVRVVVRGPSGRASATFTYRAPVTTTTSPPTTPTVPTLAVTSLSPASATALGGTGVLVSGPGVGAASRVTFGGVPGSALRALGPDQVQVTTPAHDAGTVDVVVEAAGATSAPSDGARFTFTAADPVAPAPATVTDVSPREGLAAAGQRLTLTGTGFTGATSVRFGQRVGTDLVVLSSTQLQVTTPALAPDTYHPAVVTPAGTGYGAAYDVVRPPFVTRVDPHLGPSAGGTRVTVTGSSFAHLDGVQAVLFGGVAGSGIEVVSDTQVVVTAPPHAAGQVDVRVRTAAGTSNADLNYDGFTYEAPVDSVGTATPVPGAELEAVSCAAAGSCFAVGYEPGVYDTAVPGAGLVEHWAGGSWTPVSVPVPEPGGRKASFHDVDCPTATFCAAVGSYLGAQYYQPFVATWDGTTWRSQVVTLPTQVSEAVASQVACTADARCVARVTSVRLSGTRVDGQVLVTYDAGRWVTTQVATPDPVTLDDVDCSARSCTLVGSARRDVYTPSYPVVLQGAGTSWTTTAPGSPSDRAATGNAVLFAVSCPAEGSCLAAGTYGRTSTSGQEILPTPYAATLSAGRWTTRSLASTEVADQATYVHDVACGSVGDCTLVGSVGAEEALVVRVAGTQVTTTAFHPPNADLLHPSATLDRVVCGASGRCAAVGSYATAGPRRALYVQLSGGQVSAATQPPAPTDGSGIDELVQGLALDPAGTAVAVWQYRTSTTTTAYLVRGLPV